MLYFWLQCDTSNVYVCASVFGSVPAVYEARDKAVESSSKHSAAHSVGFDHINRNPPVLIRTPKLTRFEPAQYWGGGPPGNSVVLNPFFLFFFGYSLFFFLFFVLFHLFLLAF